MAPLQEIRQLRHSGKLTEAYMLCKYYYDKNPQDEGIVGELTEMALALDAFEAAESLAKHLLTLNHTQARYWAMYAESLVAQCKDSEAEKALLMVKKYR